MDSWTYLDNNSTTPIDPLVIDAVVEEMNLSPSNPSSGHSLGKKAKARLSQARKLIAEVMQADPSEIIFTSGASEAINTLLRGYCIQHPTSHIITSDIEHACIYQTCTYLQKNGHDITFLEGKKRGYITLDAIQSSIKDRTSLVILSAANAETGDKIDLVKISKFLHEQNILFVVDAVAFFGKEPLHVLPGISAMVFSAHKFHGPQGVGFMYCKKELDFSAQITGGHQEFGKRSGTENLPGIIGMCKAVCLVGKNINKVHSHLQKLRDHFESTLENSLKNVWINKSTQRVANTSNVAFKNIRAETLLFYLDQAKIALSHGSACASGAIEPSRVLLNMGYPLERVMSSLRFSFSKMNTIEEVNKVCEVLIELVTKLDKI